MAKETRTVKHYKVFTLVVNLDESFKFVRSVALAVFDDMDIVVKYLKASQGKLGAQNTRIEENWVEIKPEQINYNLPFNPKFDPEAFAAMFEKKLEPRVEKPVVKKISKAEPVSNPDELEGIKINKKIK